MKAYFLPFILCMGFFLHGCGESLTDSRYVLEFPEIPPGWEALLGNPYWQIEWLNDQGGKETAIVRGDAHIEIVLPQTFASAVSALPFWPEKGLRAGVFRPAGAIFPYDIFGNRLILSWQGGVDANLFWELARSYNGAGEDNDAPPEVTAAVRAVSRVPWNFNWPRFRQLFNDSTLNADVRADPWLADWRTIAEKIVQSGFDKRRLVPEPRSNLPVPVGPGPWIGTSPFAAPLLFEGTPVFSARATADTWVSAEGILRCNSAAWIFISD